MAIKGVKAQRLADEVLRRVGPHLPADAQVTIVQMGSFRYFIRRRPNGGSVSPIISFARTPIPLPRLVAAKLAAIDAVETVLSLGFDDAGRSAKNIRKRLAVAAAIDGDVVRVSYQQPDHAGRVDLEPIPLALL